VFVQKPTVERIKELRQEILKIREGNRLYLQGKKDAFGASEQERRLKKL
jgi:hypothetical protein